MRRRDFLRALGTTTAAAVAGPYADAAADAPLETTRIALARDPTVCPAPMYIAEQLLAGEGFTEIRYVPMERDQNIAQLLSSGRADLSTDAISLLILAADAGDAIVLLGGLHPGCSEPF